MKATTVKIEGDLLEMLEKIQEPGQSVSAFVREAVRRRIREVQRAQAAEVYNQLLSADPDEATWLEEWEQSDLAADTEPAASGETPN